MKKIYNNFKEHGVHINNLSFTIEEAIDFSVKGKIEEWIHLFLNSVGDNKALSEGLNLQKRFWLGPILISLDNLKRCTGPEPDMEYVDSDEAWEKHIIKFQQLINDGWDMPPLIAENTKGKLIIRDGNHRLEAMRREKFDKCWVVIWDNDNQDNLKPFI